MKVEDKYYIDDDEFYEKSKENEYWENAYSFYEQIKEQDIDELTHRQLKWLEKIHHQFG